MYLFYLLFLVETIGTSSGDMNNYCKNLMCKSVLFGKDSTDKYSTPCPWEIDNFEHYEMMRNDAACSWGKNSSLEYKIIHNDTGLVSFEFNYQPINCKYTNVSAVDLYLIENEIDEILHSSTPHKNIIVENNTFSVNFKYVFTGTYFIQINALKSPRMNIETQYKQKKINSNSVELIVIPPNELEFNKILKITVKLIQFHFFDEFPQTVIKFMCKERQRDSSLFDYGMVSNTCIINSTCNYENDTSFTCFYENIKPGNYTFMFKLKDHVRCNPCSVFCEYPYNNCCTFRTNIEINVSSNAKIEDDKNDAFWHEFGIVIIVAIVMIMMMAIFVICRKKSSKYHSVPNTTPSNKRGFGQDHSFDRNLEIFLLYARDTEVFMEMIKCFKNLIKIDDTITICDIYDYDEKSEDPLRWLEEKLIDENTKVILFLNECASHVYQHQMNIYKEPHCFDHLFVHSIHFIIKKKLKKSYENVFVIKLSCVDDNDCFNFLNPFVRYSMPQHIHKLLEDMCSNQVKNVDDSLLNSFKRSCAECLKFYENNIDYMYNILNVQKI